MSRSLLIALVFAGLTVGCQEAPKPPPPPEQRTLTSNDELKQMLKSVADRGKAGSELAGVPAFISKIKATDEKLANDLTSDYAELTTAGSPDAIKAVAERMLSRLK